MAVTNELRVFISSTFRDLQEEREHLIKKIFPEIRALCRERGITFTEVDLRWGLTDEQLALGQVIRACLEEVEKCRPYFIGITGDRYGFIPTFIDIQKDPALLEQYPWIEEAAIDEMSITEMETHYALLGVGTNGIDKSRCDRARFYFRSLGESLEEHDGDQEERARLEAYQQRIRDSGVSIELFRDSVSLGTMVYDDLVGIIKRDFADAKPPTPLEQERSRHEAFSLSRRRAYIANPVYLKRLNEHVASDDPPLVVYAESGSGKSSLFAYWAEAYRRKNPDAHVVEHYVGIGATSTDHYAVIRHFCMEVKERFGRDEEIPSTPEELEKSFGQWLGYADHELTKRGGRMVLILDGLNQLRGTALTLRWIPDVIAPSIRLILSSTVEGTLVQLRKRGWGQYGMQAFSVAEREAVVVRYLAEYRKALNTEQIRQIAGDYKCGHPLFLKTLLEELRLVGRHEELQHCIDEYLAATGTEDLFQRVLERMEKDYSARAVREVLVMLWGSRSGLDEEELSGVTGLSRMKVATMVAGLDYHLVKKEGLLSFFHDYLRRAVEKRYLGETSRRQQMRKDLARHFEGVTLTQRSALELLWQYGSDAEAGDSAGRDRKLAATLARPDVLVMLYRGETRFEMLGHWAQLIRRGCNVEEEYRRSLGQKPGEVEQRIDRGEVLVAAAELLQSLSQWTISEELFEELVELGRERGQREYEVQGHLGMGNVMQLRGEYGGAMDHLKEAERLALAGGDMMRLSRAIGTMGIVHTHQGGYAEAMECFGRNIEISEELGDRGGMSAAIFSIGRIHLHQGRYAEAMECYRRHLAISEELGDYSGVSAAIGSMGIVHRHLGRYAEAMECHGRRLAVCEELGDRSGMAVAIGNMGFVYTDQGRLAEAMECFGRDLEISEELGDRSGMTRAIGNMGRIHSDQGRFTEAMKCYGRQMAISEELGDPTGMSIAIGNMGVVHSHLGRHSEAMECFGRDLEICEELGDPTGMFIAIGNMGITYRVLGQYDRALECFARASEGHRAIGFRQGLTFSLEGTGGTLLGMLDGTGDAMPQYLPIHLPGASDETWRATALQQARKCAEECVAVSDDIAQPEMQFVGRILLARIDAATGAVQAGLQRLRGMLAEADDEEQMADLHYWLWKFDGGEAHHGHALNRCRSLLAKTPKHVYRKRIDELTAATNPPETTNAAE